MNPCSLIGREVNHAEAPFSEASSIALWRLEGNDCFGLNASSCCSSLRFLLTSLLNCFCVIPTSSSCCWLQIRFTRGTVMVEDASNSFAVFDVGMGMHSPPSLTGIAINFLSSSLSACLPVISGNSSYLITSSRGWKQLLYVRHQSHQICPPCHDTMGQCCVGCLRLGFGYSGQTLDLVYPFLYFVSDKHFCKVSGSKGCS